MNNFWQKIDKPILALAPMAGFTDFAFRQVCADFGADVTYSEMANVTALTYQPEKTLEMLGTTPKGAYYVVQLFGSKPKEFSKAIKVVEEKIKPDGIDINFGCPVPKVIKAGAGAELMKNLDLSREVIKETIKNSRLPVSIKIRTQAGEVDAWDFFKKVEDLDIKAIMIHGRSLAQGFRGEIDFELIEKIQKNFSGTVLANGGINNLAQAKETLDKTGAQGLGLARGCLGRPWLFQEIKQNKIIKKTQEEIFQIAFQHALLTQKDKGEKGVIELRKHLPWYVHGFDGAKKIREKLVKTKDIKEVENIFNF